MLPPVRIADASGRAAMREGRRRPSLLKTYISAISAYAAAMREGRRRPSLARR